MSDESKLPFVSINEAFWYACLDCGHQNFLPMKPIEDPDENKRISETMGVHNDVWHIYPSEVICGKCNAKATTCNHDHDDDPIETLEQLAQLLIAIDTDEDIEEPMDTLLDNTERFVKAVVWAREFIVDAFSDGPPNEEDPPV